MLFFLDTADIQEIETGLGWGMVDGITTNPSLIAKQGKKYLPTVQEIARLVPGPVSGEVLATAHDEILAQGRRLAELASNVVVKVPLTPDGLRACRTLRDEGTHVNVTLCFSPSQALVAGYMQELAAAQSPGTPAAGLVQPEIRIWFNPSLESRDFMIPGIVALLLLVVTTNLSAMAIVREKEVGTLEQLNVTPLARWELIAGKMLPYAMIGVIDVVLVLIVSIYWFEVPMRGSIPLLFAMSLVYLMSTLGLGLFISSISQTQQQAMMTATFFFLTPMIYLSGFIFPIENMPGWIQPLTFLIPLRYFLVIVRGIFLKGVGLETFWPQALALFTWGAVVLTLATLRSSKRLV